MATLVSDVLTYSRTLCQTDANGLTDTNGLVFVNDALENFTRELLKRNIDAAQTQEAYTDLATAGQFAWPSDMFSLKTIELNYTDTTQSNYVQATIVDIANLPDGTSFDYLRANQPNSSPLFDNRGDTYEVFPTPLTTVSRGIRLFYYLIPTEYGSVSSTLNYPQTLDYRCLSARVASLYKKSLGDLPISDAFEKEYQDRLQGIIAILAPGTAQPIKAEPLHLTGWNF